MNTYSRLLPIILCGLSTCLSLYLTACEDTGCGVIGDSCLKECGAQQVATCVTNSICACVAESVAGDIAGEEGGMSAGDGGGETIVGGMDGGDQGPRECRTPATGELLINEVLIDPEGDENRYEFVELVNISTEALDLSGVKLVYNGSEKVVFVSGCMAAQSMVALFSSEEEWLWSSPPGGLEYTKSAFRFTNSGDFHFELKIDNDMIFSEMSGESTLIESGVSLNRSPDIEGDLITLHTNLSSFSSSPSVCVMGGRFEDGCPSMIAGDMAGALAGTSAGNMAGDMAGDIAGASAGDIAGSEPPPLCDPPRRGELLINEVMIDPAGDESTDEYVELANITDRFVYLGGITFRYKDRDQILFFDGCMPPHSIGALYDDESLWQWTTDVEGLAYEKRSFQFTNSSDFEFTLSLEVEGEDRQIISRFFGLQTLIEEGVSVNRSPDFDPDSENVFLHTDLNEELEKSPGFCANGGLLDDRCFVELTDMGIEDMGIEDMGIEDMGIEDMGIEDMGIEDMGIEDMGMMTDDMGMMTDDMGMMTDDMGMMTDDMGMMTDDMGMMTDDMGMMTDDMGMMTDDMGMMTDDMGMMTDDMGMMTDDMGMMTDDMGMMTDDMGMMTDDMGMMTDDMGMMTDDMGMNPTCITPIVGQLVINEVLANPQGNESSDRSEWVEILNVTDDYLDFEGLSLWEAGTEEVIFGTGCMAPQSALVLFNQRENTQWRWTSPPLGVLDTSSSGTFGITNSNDLLIELKRGETLINSFSALSTLITSGVSANRSPDGDPNGEIVRHSDLIQSIGPLSEGSCPNGATYESRCQP